MTTASSFVSGSGSGSLSSKPATGVSDQFPVGLRVLVVDDDVTCLKILEQMLRRCSYHGKHFAFLFRFQYERYISLFVRD